MTDASLKTNKNTAFDYEKLVGLGTDTFVVIAKRKQNMRMDKKILITSSSLVCDERFGLSELVFCTSQDCTD